ncbi:MAG: hypothetical protein U0354_13100 [Candidatus Sericytochromatia bacterium]
MSLKTIKADFKFKIDDYKDDDKNNGKDKEYKNFKIDKVKISENNKQVDNNGTESIIPDYSNSKKINLTIDGNFPEDFDKNKFFFRNDTNLLHLSYVGESNLKTVVLIDDSIVLNPISASNKYINVSIDTKNVPDFYLKGLHKIKVINENKSVSSMVRFGDPIKPNDSLTPQISKIELLKKEDDDEIKVIGLKLTGKNFMINPQFYYTKVDGVFCKGYQTDVVKTSGGDIFETIIDLSKQSNFLSKSNHVIEFYTPFGMIYSEFKV